MIKKEGREIIEIRIGGKVITHVYNKMHLIYEANLSCFGKGYWENNAPYLNDDSWKNE